MFCPGCGHPQPDASPRCGVCGISLQVPARWHPASPPTASVPSHLGWAIVATVAGFTPFGLVAVYHGLQVQARIGRGDHAGASVSSTRARKWAMASGIATALSWAVTFLMLR